MATAAGRVSATCRGWPAIGSAPRVVRRIVEDCARRSIGYLTVFAFSSENWQRPPDEVSLLMELFLRALRDEETRLLENDIRLSVIGDRAGLPARLQTAHRAGRSQPPPTAAACA